MPTFDGIVPSRQSSFLTREALVVETLAKLLEFLLYAIGQWVSGLTAGCMLAEAVGEKNPNALGLGVGAALLIPATASMWMPALQEKPREKQSAVLTIGTLLIAGAIAGWQLKKLDCNSK